MIYDEIVQALRCCSYGCVCEKCPSRQDENCIDHVNVSAAAAIERLVAENAALRKEIEWKDKIQTLYHQKIANFEAERDAALADLADARSCKTCKYACDTRDCSSCKSKTCKCRECHLDKNAWAWRGLPGVPEEGGKA